MRRRRILNFTCLYYQVKKQIKPILCCTEDLTKILKQNKIK